MPAPRKSPRYQGWSLSLLAFGAAGLVLQAQSPEGAPAAVRPSVAGAATCATSGCHGGADEKSRQYVLWAEHDVHSRSSATLVTARAARMAEALKIGSPAASPRCTVCHAPLQAVDPVRLAPGVLATEGVSCASCHGLPENWLRSHTRADWTHQDRVAAGMRDLEDLYVRANSCVACHQNLDPELVGVGRHPALTFELDGQTQSEPKHWHDPAGSGAQAWYVGQAVAFREMSWAGKQGDSGPASPRWQGLLWILQRSGLEYDLPSLDRLAAGATAVEAADLLARRAAQSWKPEYTADVLHRLAATRAEFSAAGIPVLVQACRAERLVLALDRLLAALPAAQRPPAASVQLDRLFRLVQSQPDFQPAEFARELEIFARAL